MRSPRVALSEGPARLKSARFRGPVLDAVGAGLLWGVMAVDLAERPLAPGQSASTVVAYLLAGAICALLELLQWVEGAKLGSYTNGCGESG